MVAARNARRQPRSKPAIDPATGTVRLDDRKFVLRPALTVQGLRKSPLARTAKVVRANEYIVYVALPPCRIGGRRFGVTLTFDPKTQIIDWIGLRLLDADFEKHRVGNIEDAARHAAHEDWLKAQLRGVPLQPSGERRFPWGYVEAQYVPQNEESWIVIGYEAPAVGGEKA
jgi:hypothetical protein